VSVAEGVLCKGEWILLRDRKRSLEHCTNKATYACMRVWSPVAEGVLCKGGWILLTSKLDCAEIGKVLLSTVLTRQRSEWAFSLC